MAVERVVIPEPGDPLELEALQILSTLLRRVTQRHTVKMAETGIAAVIESSRQIDMLIGRSQWLAAQKGRV